MLQTTQRLLAPRCISQLHPIKHISALQKRTPSTRPKLPKVSVEKRAAFPSSSKNGVRVAFPTVDSSDSDRYYPGRDYDPLSADTTWPPRLLEVFDLHRPECLPNMRYFAPYYLLLRQCFFRYYHPGPQLTIEPRRTPLPSARWEEVVTNFVVFLSIGMHWHPVMIVDIKDDGWRNHAELRAKADEQMYERFDLMFGRCPPIPCLWGLSLLGTSLRVYRGDVATRKISPAFKGPPSPFSIPQDFLEGAWNIDILSQEGFNTMKEINGYIFEDIAALGLDSNQSHSIT
ncbi:hypothetical protein BDZ89DRAFT_1167028 [Hymenopellis radicata]|nr:hypothetical protein BDZ89DRAFT_1167028 [Hymenopellis radicata]